MILRTLVAQEDQGEVSEKGIKRILLATDGSEDARHAAAIAATLAAGVGASVTLLHVAPDAGLPLGTMQLGTGNPQPGPEDEVGILKTVWEGAQVILDESTRPFDRLGVPVEGLVQEGDVAEEILRLAGDRTFDLLVLGRRGMGGTDSELGSTASTIVREARCPVLLVSS